MSESNDLFGSHSQSNDLFMFTYKRPISYRDSVLINNVRVESAPITSVITFVYFAHDNEIKSPFPPT